VAVVCAAMLRDAVAVAQGAKDEGSKGKDEEEEEMAAEFLRQQNGDSRMQAAQSGEQNEASCERAGDEQRVVDDRVGRWLRVWLSAIYEALLKAPTDVMTKEPWVPLREYLADLTTDVDAGALEAWQGITTAAGAVAWIEGDEKNRAHLRTTLMLLLCAAHDASGSERPGYADGERWTPAYMTDILELLDQPMVLTTNTRHPNMKYYIASKTTRSTIGCATY
jgi:hypothetical protein